jgi:tRNA (mo5U34)-methyltransferase
MEDVMPEQHIVEQVQALQPWFHNLHLPDGTQTAPDHFLGDFPSYKWQEISPWLPKDLHGVRALDIGCNAGYYSFELAKRGATVTAIDIDEHYLQQATWAAKTLGLANRIEFRKGTVYELIHEQSQYDLVWFMGVLYHLRHPLLALDIIRRRCSGQMIFQTMTMPGENVLSTDDNYSLSERDIMNDPGWPKMAFIEHNLERDPTNWWAPNHACVEAMLRAAGFGNIKKIAHEIYCCDGVTAPSSLAVAELDSLFAQHR